MTVTQKLEAARKRIAELEASEAKHAEENAGLLAKLEAFLAEKNELESKLAAATEAAEAERSDLAAKLAEAQAAAATARSEAEAAKAEADTAKRTLAADPSALAGLPGADPSAAGDTSTANGGKAPETFAEAVRACGDYERARREYPDLFSACIEAARKK